MFDLRLKIFRDKKLSTNIARKYLVWREKNCFVFCKDFSAALVECLFLAEPKSRLSFYEVTLRRARLCNPKEKKIFPGLIGVVFLFRLLAAGGGLFQGSRAPCNNEGEEVELSSDLDVKCFRCICQVRRTKTRNQPTNQPAGTSCLVNNSTIVSVRAIFGDFCSLPRRFGRKSPASSSGKL